MKFLLTVFALIGIAAAVTVPDSATQGPNPQDIATPEPEYIDIDLPEPAPAPKSAPEPRPISRVMQTFAIPQAPYHISQQLPGHIQTQAGYQYRRPVFIRRVYRHRF